MNTTHTPKTLFLTGIVLAGIGFFGPRVHAQTIQSTGRAGQLLKANASAILAFAHPTGTYSSCALGEPASLRDGGFAITLRVYFTNFQECRSYSDIPFYFDGNGLLKSIGRGGTDDGFPAFAASWLMFESIRYAVLQDETLDAESRRTIENVPDAKSLLLYLLQLSQLFE